jgi:hypothetical protein
MHKDYSQTPLPKKLGIREGSRVALQGAPQGFAEAIDVSPRTRGKLDVVVVFATRQGELIRHFPVLARRLEQGRDVYCYFRHEDEPTAPLYAERLLELVGRSASR